MAGYNIEIGNKRLKDVTKSILKVNLHNVDELPGEPAAGGAAAFLSPQQISSFSFEQ